MGTYKGLPEGRKMEILVCVALGHGIGFDVSAAEAEEIAGDFIWRLGCLTGVSIKCDLVSMAF